jgi:hypothetical protein
VPSPSVAIAIRHDLEDFNLAINMFNGNPLPRQLAIKRLFFRRQRLVLGFLKRHFTIRMQRRNALIAAVRLDLHIRTHRTARAGLVKSEIVNTARRLLNKEDQQRV